MSRKLLQSVESLSERTFFSALSRSRIHFSEKADRFSSLQVR